jgi:high affinity Mn2+ porin
MASYNDALLYGRQTNTTPAVEPVRRYSSRPGIVLNMEQELSSDVGAFARVSANRGDKETYEFTDINQSLSAGLLIQGDIWTRHDDSVGMALVENRISADAQKYFAAGGLGVLIGDGKLNYAPEKIMELFYSMRLVPSTSLTLDYQYISNPAYNQDRGPVSIYGIRLHANF